MPKKTEVEQKKRMPIVSILGHVDHGKTTILDQIRKTNVQLCEFGGITQKISSFTVCPDAQNANNKITFIDTPGHEAFDLMRVRGGSIADVVLLIVAGDDGVKPQTKESIQIIKNSSASPIVVINKCDLPNVDIEKVKREISNEGLLLEGMGGQVPVVQVSGKTGQGIDDLVETINLVVDIEGIKRAEIEKKMEDKVLGVATVLESIKDGCVGCLSSIVVTAGNFKSNDIVVFAKKDKVESINIRGFQTEDCKNVSILIDGQGGKIIGIKEILDLGSVVLCLPKEKKKDAEAIYKEYAGLIKKQDLSVAEEVKTPENSAADADAFWANVFQEKKKDESFKNLNVVIKSVSEGSLEAIKKSLDKVSKQFAEQNVRVNIVDASVGEINQSDVETAFNSRAIILGFQVDLMSSAKIFNERRNVLIRSYNIIYELIDEVTASLEMLAGNDEIEEDIGFADVKGVFTLSDGKIVVGGIVKSGVIKSGEKCYILRNDDIIAKGKIVSLKHVKDEIKSASKGTDFGAIIEPKFEGIQAGDVIYCYKMVALG